jgi:hypothetical protein
MTVKPPRHRLVQLTGAGTTLTGAVSAVDVVVRITLAGSVPTAAELILLALAAAFAVLGVGVVRRSLAATRGAGLVALLLVPAAYVRLTSAVPGPTPALSFATFLVVGLAATILFTALVAVVGTLTAERNSVRGGRYVGATGSRGGQWPPTDQTWPLDDRYLDAAAHRPPYPYPHPLPAPVKQAHVAVVRRTVIRQLWLSGLLGVPGTALFLATTMLGSPGTAAWATSPALLGAAAVVTYSALARRAWARRLRHRTLLLEYGVLLDAFGREIPLRYSHRPNR